MSDAPGSRLSVEYLKRRYSPAGPWRDGWYVVRSIRFISDPVAGAYDDQDAAEKVLRLLERGA